MDSGEPHFARRVQLPVAFTAQACGCTRILVLLLLAAGCTYTAQIRPPAMAEPIVTPLPLKVGVYFGEELRQYQPDQRFLTDTFRFPIGAASIPWFEYGFAGTFASLEKLTAWPPAQADSSLDAVLELRLTDFTYSVRGDFSVEFTVVLSSPEGEEIARFPVGGSYQVDAAMHAMSAVEGLQHIGKAFATEEYFGEHIEAALRQAVTGFVLDFREQPSVRQWLDSRGAFRPVLPSEPAGLPPDRRGAGGTPATVLILEESSPLGACLTQALTAAGMRVLAPGEARDAFFPWLEPPVNPQAAGGRFLQSAGTARGAARLRDTGLRYVIGVSSTMNTSGFWGILCGAGFSFGGCFGVAWGEHKTTVAASVSDLHRGTTEAQQVEERGGEFIPAFILPIPLWWSTKAEACADLGKAVRTYIESIGEDARPLSLPSR